MKYKRIKRVPFSGNSNRNLYLRQQYAIKMIELLGQDQCILNIDETWLSRTDFRRRKWKFPGISNSVENPLINPRISIIVALSNHGDLYYAISQGNTNKESFKLFMVYLMKQLDLKSPQWRNNTVIQLDGAKYHTCEDTKIDL